MSQNMIAVKAETPTPCYLVCPRFLTELPYAALSAEAKLLYTLMLDRASVSCENGYLEPDGSIRIYFTVEDVRQKLETIEGLKRVDVNLVFEPEWTKDMMTEEARMELGFL